MLVYDDAEQLEDTRVRRAALEYALAALGRMPPGLDRHAALVSAFIGASELVQAIADAEFEERGFDVRSLRQDAGMQLLLDLARAIEWSWRSAFQNGLPLPASVAVGLRALDHPSPVRIKQAEGYAFYALYPESYLEAAFRSGLGPETRVIGIRSIGVGLAAMVAAAIGARAPITLRPVGHPFHRQLSVDLAITAELTADSEAQFAIADEGPGLSGSSFGAVADWLEANGIARERIHFFPSHHGDPGPYVSASHRERWANAARHSVDVYEFLLDTSISSHRLETWVADLLGPLDRPLEDLSGGLWRYRHYPAKEEWPASTVQLERRKFLARSGGVAWHVKFAGLGKAGARKLQVARSLYTAGFAPEIADLRHGFLVERWHEGARTLDQASVDRVYLIERIGAYLGFRARHLPASRSGASLSDLLHMAFYNTRQALGSAAAEELEQRLRPGLTLGDRILRVDTDNRMHRHEWLVLGDDDLIKTDALDHSASHDLVGCQDIAWDVAGAIVEFSLSNAEGARLCSVVEQEGGQPVDLDLLAFLQPCYLAFQLGSAALAAEAVESEEAIRLRAAADAYGAALSAWLGAPTLVTANVAQAI